MNLKSFLYLLMILIFLVGCDAKRVYEDYYTTNAEGWNKDSIANFNIEITNPSQSYNILINSRNLENYPYSNLWLFVDLQAPDSTTIRDTVEYQLALPDGKWIGKGTSGVYHNQYDFRSNVFFPAKGIYKISIQQAMRDDVLKGMKNIGVRVEKRY